MLREHALVAGTMWNSISMQADSAADNAAGAVAGHWAGARVPTLYTRFSMLEVLMRVVTFTTSPLSFFLYSITVLTPLASGPVTEPTGISRSSSSSSVSAHLILDAMLGTL
jgi:hypothetical protein